MSLTEACCTLPPVSSDYQPEGTEITIGDLTVYETKNKTPKILVVCAYDIFGFHENVKQFADKLNSSGIFRVVMPDFFRGQPIKEEDMVGDFRPKIMAFIGERGSWDKTVKQDMLNVIAHYKKEGITAIGMYGFCWGGKISARGVAELDGVKGAALIHPSLLNKTDAEEAKAPVLFLPTKDEEDLTPLVEIVKGNLGADNVEHHRFDDMFHGFCGARGDWKDELQSKRVNDAIALVHAFFKKHLTK